MATQQTTQGRGAYRGNHTARGGYVAHNQGGHIPGGHHQVVQDGHNHGSHPARGGYAGRGGHVTRGGHVAHTEYQGAPKLISPVFTGEIVLVAHKDASWKMPTKLVWNLFKACRESGQQQSVRVQHTGCVYMVVKESDDSFVFSKTSLDNVGQRKVVTRSIRVVALPSPSHCDNGTVSEEEAD